VFQGTAVPGDAVYLDLLGVLPLQAQKQLAYFSVLVENYLLGD
jgi:hypothetical protein